MLWVTSDNLITSVGVGVQPQKAKDSINAIERIKIKIFFINKLPSLYSFMLFFCCKKCVLGVK